MRRLLRLDGSGGLTVATESPFPSEQLLHDAIEARPEVLPSEDLGLGSLIAVASELSVGTGSVDLLAVDGTGQLVLVEFKRGSEGSDVRKVIAQILDYGSAIWRVSYDELEER